MELYCRWRIIVGGALQVAHCRWYVVGSAFPSPFRSACARRTDNRFLLDELDLSGQISS